MLAMFVLSPLSGLAGSIIQFLMRWAWDQLSGEKEVEMSRLLTLVLLEFP